MNDHHPISTGPTRVLLVEDDADDVILVRRSLERSKSEQFIVKHERTIADARKELQAHHHHVVLLDLGLPDAHGDQAVRSIREAAPDLPVVVMTDRDDYGFALSTLALGAQDYLTKGPSYDGLLERSIRYAIERQRIQLELDETRQSQLRLKDEFLSHVSHELRTPLTAIYQFVGLLRDGIGGSISTEQREFLDITMRNVDQLKQMISDLMEGTRAQSGKLRISKRRVELGPVLEETVRVLKEKADAKGIRLDTVLAEAVPLAFADENRICQVVTNLVENAIKFTAEQGSIQVELQPDPSDCDYLRVSIHDTGCGISEQACGRIFERLHQEESQEWESRKGLGLGLYICKQLVEGHGGRIWVESEVGKGSSFHVALPVYSLASLIRPALMDGARLRDTYSIIRVIVGPDDPDASLSLPESIIREVLEAVRGAIIPDIDVLLPPLTPSGAFEECYVVAGTDQVGLQVVSDRIRKSVVDRIQSANLNLCVEVHGQTKEDLTRRELSVDETLQRIATEVDAMIQDQSW